ncbi:laccase [Mycena floridula]|nr:laccase [Mycena floridula]
MFTSKAFFSLLLAVFSLAVDVNVTFNIDNTVVAPDGFARAGVIVNGIFPGTLIQAQKNDVLHITTNNLLTDPTMRRSLTIHWHGLFQFRTASEDGPAFLTQCPVAPNHTYTYDIPLNGQSGTYWYHSHLASQYVDGLRGVLIVYDPEDPALPLYDVDDASTVITLADWYHLPAIGIEEAFLQTAPFHEPVPDSGLINGAGRFNGGPQVALSRVNVVSGRRYRFRIINISAYASFTFSIQGHRMTIIEVDGVNHRPLTVDEFDIHAAQRYSVVVAANQPVNNYWIRGPMTLQHASDNKNLDMDNVFAVFHYEGASNAEPTTKPDFSAASTTILEEYQLRPLDNAPAPGGHAPADHVIDLRFGQDTSNGVNQWFINDISYVPPQIPTLYNIMENNFTLASQFSINEHTFVLAANETVELVIHGSSHGHIHPFHLHGHAFSIIQSMGGPANYVNPPRRDVIGVGGSTVIIRFKADNPGPWFLHCHIDWHLLAGLAVVFAETPREQQSGPHAQIIKPTWVDLCSIYKNLPPELQ